MNTKLQKDLKTDKSNPWDDLLGFKSEKEEIEHDAQMLMFKFLSEVQKYQYVNDIKRNTLADKIKTSASYLTQIFRGNKPLNFDTLAKFQKALDIKFEIRATPVTSVVLNVTHSSTTFSVKEKGMVIPMLSELSKQA